MGKTGAEHTFKTSLITNDDRIMAMGLHVGRTDSSEFSSAPLSHVLHSIMATDSSNL